MTTKERHELTIKLAKISARLEQASKGWCVTYETPKETREWIGKLHLEAQSGAYQLGEIVNSFPEATK